MGARLIRSFMPAASRQDQESKLPLIGTSVFDPMPKGGHPKKNDVTECLASFEGFVLVGMAMVGIGLIVAFSGLAWQAPVEELLTSHALTRWPELYLPYWPFEPYFSVFIIAFGVFLTTMSQKLQAE